MSQSEFIASLIGPVLLAVSCSLILNRDTFQSMLNNLEDNLLVVMLAGIAILIAGIAIVRLHDVWQGWPVIITLFGWLAILGGLVRILFAPRMLGIAKKMAANTTVLNISIAVSLLAGLFLTGKGFALI